MKKSCSCYSFVILCLTLAAFLNACGETSSKQQTAPKASRQPTDIETITELNRYLSEKDRAVIEGYARRNKLDLTLSQSGFFYTIFDEGKGEQIKEGDEVTITGSIKLIDGTPSYTFTQEEPKTLLVAQSPEMSGLHVALPMLKNEGHALFIFPPNLSFGLLGDGDKIPSRSIVVLDIQVTNVVQR